MYICLYLENLYGIRLSFRHVPTPTYIPIHIPIPIPAYPTLILILILNSGVFRFLDIYTMTEVEILYAEGRESAFRRWIQ